MKAWLGVALRLGVLGATGAASAGEALALDAGDRIERRLDHHAAWAYSHGRENLARQLDLTGNRIDVRIDRRGDRVDARWNGRGDRFDRRRDRRD